MPSLALDLHAELVNLLLLFAALLKVGICTGLIVVPIVLIAHENWKRGRNR